MRLLVDGEFANLPAIEYIKTVLEEVGTHRLGELKIRRSRASNSLPNVYGNMKWPRLSAKTAKARQYRISISVMGSDADYPWKSKHNYGGLLRHECRYDKIDTLIVYTAMHEIYHYLAAIGKLEGKNPRSEYDACTFGFAMTAVYLKERGEHG